MAFEIITQAPRRQKIAFAIVLLVILVGAGYFFLLSPKRAEVSDLRQQRATKEAELMQSRALAQSLARFKQEAQALRARLEAAKERLPSEKEIPGLYRQVSELAFQSGLAVTLFQPKEPSVKDVYQEVPIAVSAETGFHQLGRFLDRVARLPRIVNLTDLRLTAISTPSGTVRAELTMATYVFRSEGAPPPSARAGVRPPTPPAPGAAR